MWSGSWAVPCPLIFLCLSERDRWPTTSVFGVLRKINTCVFRRPLCQSRGVGGFSWRYSLRLPHAPFAVDWVPVPSQQQIAWYIGYRGNVFTHSPSLCNPYVIQFSRYYSSLLCI